MIKIEKSIIHLAIQKRLLDNSRMGNLSIKKAVEVIGRLYHLDKRIVSIVIKELENCKLVKRTDRNNMYIHPCDVDWENNSKLYSDVGIF